MGICLLYKTKRLKNYVCVSRDIISRAKIADCSNLRSQTHVFGENLSADKCYILFIRRWD